jgi:hypothetical protein
VAYGSAQSDPRSGQTRRADGSPERRAVERIKRKARGMTVAAAVEPAAESLLGPPEDAASERVHPRLARKCRCADAQVKAYWEEAIWICHTCGHELSARATRQLTTRAQKRADARCPSSATQVQRAVA